MAVRFRLNFDAVIDTDVHNLALGSLSFYDTTTLNLCSIYTDNARGTPALNPYSLDSAGQHGDIFLPNKDVRVRVKDSAGAVVPGGDIDPIHGIDTEDVEVTIEHTYDGGGSVPSTGVKGDKRCEVTGTIVRWTLEADQAGNIVYDIWKKPFSANSPPTVANTITASAKPTLSGVQSGTSTALTGWTTAVTAGDTFRFNIDSASTLTRATLTLSVQRTLTI